MVATKQVREVSPLPAGRYWLMVNGAANVQDFDQWVRDMAGAVRVESSEGGAGKGAGQLFVIFNVPVGRAPFLNSAQFGFPNTAPPGVRSSQDVEQVPDAPEETLTPFLHDAAISLGTPVLLLLALWALSTMGSGRSSSRRRYA